MKTRILLTILMCVTALGFAQTVGDTFNNNNIQYEVTVVGITNEVITTDYTGANTTVNIPATVTDATTGFSYNVTEIGNASFDSNSLISVTIPNSVTSIGDYAFGDNELTSVTIPNSVISIGNYAFWTNNLLTSITFGNQLESIGYAAFRECSLINVDIPDSVTSISSYAFFGNGTITNITLSSSLNTLGGFVFSGNTTVAKVISKSTTPPTLASTTFTNSNNNSNIDLIIPGNAKVAYANADWTGFRSISIYIPDTNFKAALIADTGINTDGNTEISCAEATAFTGTIDVSNQGIVDLTGIEAFVNITELNCRNNSLTSLDVSLNTTLESLTVDYNTLTSLNIANGNNINFTTFLAENNPNLACIEVDDVAYADANFTNIDATASFSTNCVATASIVDNTFNNAISIYPNPIQNTLNVSLAIGQTLKNVEVFTLLGKKVLEATTTTIDFSAITTGVYVLKVENTQGKVAVRKIIKE